MSDDGIGPKRGGKNGGVANLTSVSRNATVTESLDRIFDLLSDPRRRYLLYYLFTLDENVVEFAAAVNAVHKYEAAGREADDCSTREEIRIALHHVHLPRLADAGAVEFDHRQGTIRFAEPPTLEEWAEHAQYKELE